MHLPFLYSLSGILLAYTLKKIRVLKPEDTASLSRIVTTITFPAVILLNMSETELTPDLLILPLLPVLMGLCGIGAGIFLFRKYSAETRGLMIMGAMGLNLGLFAFPILEALFGPEGLRVAAAMDVGNAFTIFGISYMTGARFSPKAKEKRGFLKTAGTFLKSPPLTAYLVAILINGSGLSLPLFLKEGMAILSRANYFLVLTILGLFLRFDWVHLGRKGVFRLILLRYAAALAFSLLLWFFLPFDPLTRKVAVICLFLPIGFMVIPYSIEFGYDSKIAGGMANLSLVTGFFVMWGLVITL